MKIRKILLLLIVLAVFVNAQTGSINNTLGTGGSFIVKDGTDNFMRVDQLTGNVIFLRNLELGNQDNSNQSIGLITKNGIRFIHNYRSLGTDGFNTFVGLYSGNFPSVSGPNYYASYNTSVGFGSIAALTSGFSNSALGWGSLTSNTTGFRNSAFGDASLYSNTTGDGNAAFGYHSLFSNQDGYSNSAFGQEALYFSNGLWNSAFGFQSLYSNTANNNSAFGNRSLYSNTSGEGNNAFGSQALYSNATGYWNSAFGSQSLYSNYSGDQNSAFGYQSMYSNTTGFLNTAVGSFTLQSNLASGQNSAFGYYALNDLVSGGKCTAIGALAGSLITGGWNLTLIGYGAEASMDNTANEITLGNYDVTTLRCNVQYITSLSDVRDKKNIKDLSLGLDFLMKVKPREFNWDRREWYENGISDGSKIKDHPTAGFIAQEFDSLQNTEHAEWLSLVLKNNPDKWEATYGNLLPVIVKAVQDLKKEKDELKNELNELSHANRQLAEQNQSLVKEISLFKQQFQIQLENLMSQMSSVKSEITEVTMGD